MEDKLKEEIKLKLGAPIRQIELTDEHYNIAFLDAMDSYELYNPKHKPVPKKIWVDKFALANCKEILGRVRGKFGGVVGSEDKERIMDHKSLLSESKNEKNDLINLFDHY